MPLDIGRRLGPYEILSHLGAGGMGEVYEARDTRLGRTVAIKVLPESLATDTERRARFDREARTVSQLSHPHVCTLHDVGEEDGVCFLVLEHCEGETLAVRLERGPLPPREVLRYGAEIAEALDAAHRRGVIHRDLKPANVMLTSSGVKLLDFGLARLAAEEPGRLGDLPTMTLEADQPLTDKGTVLGTFPYMAPEQVEGRQADARSDIFALGAVLYEMTTGRRAFAGRSAASIMAAVLREEPEPISAVQSVSAPALDHVVSHCLAKDPEERWQSAKDVAVELQWIAEAGSQAGVATPVAQRRQSRERLAWGLLALTVLALLALVTVWRIDRASGGAQGPPLVRFSIEPPAGVVNVANPVVAADGSFLVYVGSTEAEGRRLYLRDLDELSSRPLPGTKDAVVPFLSPDGRWVGFGGGGGLRKIARAGGDVLTVLEDGAHGPGATWGREGTIVFSTSWLGGLAEVGDEGGEPRPLTEPDRERGEIGHWWPHFLPNGRDVLFTVFPAATGINDASIGVLDRESGEVRILLPGAQPLYVASGHLVFYRAGGYHTVGFDPDTLEIQGDPVRLLEDARELNPVGYPHHWISVSTSGTLAFVPGRLFPEGSLQWITPGGDRQTLPIPSRSYQEVRISPTGQRAALTSLEAGRLRLRIVHLERGIEEVLDLAGNTEDPTWHPDGSRLAWQSMRKGDLDIYWKDLDVGGPEEPLLVTDVDEWPHAFTGDGSRLLLTRTRPGGSYGTSLLELDGDAEPRPLFGYAEKLTLSPQDRWLAYEDAGVVVRPFLREGGPIRVSSARGSDPRWVEGARKLLYQRGDEIVEISYREEGGRFVVDDERVLTTIPGLWSWDLAPDGRILALVEDQPGTRAEIRVVLGWHQELTRMAAPP